MQATFCSLYVDELASLKAAALYFDKIVVPTDIGVIGPVHFDEKFKRPRTGDKGTLTVAAAYKTRPPQFEQTLRPLVDEGVIVLPDVSDYDNDIHYAFLDAFDKEVKKLPKDAEERVFIPFNPALFMTKPPELDFGTLRIFYAAVLRSAFLESARYQSPILTDMTMLNDILTQFLIRNPDRVRTSAKAKSGYLAHRVLTEMLPNIGNARIEDILEVRTRFKDDLGEFRAAMSELSGSILSHPWSPEIEEEVEKIVETKVRPKVAGLGKSLRTSHLELVKNLFKNLSDPTSYSPLIAAVNPHVGDKLAALAAAGVIGFRALYDTYLERRKIKDASGLTFLLKASNMFPGS
jgi:hypothetical protein